MAIDQRLRAALSPFERRAALVTLVRLSAPGLIGGIVAAEALWLLEMRHPAALMAPAAIALLIGAAWALARRPSPLTLARRIDAGADLRDLVVSAVSCEGNGMTSLVRDSAISTLARLSPADILSFELPRQWRTWVGAAMAAQLVVLPMIWRAPASRSAESGLSSVTLPPSSGTAANPSRQGPPPQTAAAAEPAASPAASAVASRPVAVLPGQGEIGSDPAAAGGDGPGRLRLAATAADAEIAAGRVPIARRAIVQRYFATLQTQRKQDR